MYKYCDCKDHKGNINRYKANNGRNKMKITETKNDICIHCGNFAVVNKNPLVITQVSKRNIKEDCRFLSNYLN